MESYGEGYTVNGLPVTEIQINGLAVRGREELEAVPSIVLRPLMLIIYLVVTRM